MPHRLAAALVAAALALQATPAVAAFAEREHDCCCTRGTEAHRRSHRCGCVDCARRSQQERGCPSIGGCAPDPAPVLPVDPQSFPLLAAHSKPSPSREVPPRPAGPAPPLGPSEEVPTPPPRA
jgi:hypothetical protein